jgi:tetratricopeptide (TPR) repeat protein
VGTLFATAFAQHRAGAIERAEAGYRQVLAIDPDHADSLHLLGLARAGSGRAEEAIGLITRAVALRPDFALAHYNLGNALRRAGRAEAATEAYRRAIRLHPGWGKALVNLGVTLRELGRAEEALEAYRSAIAADPGDAEAHYNLGVALRSLGREAEAVEAYRRAATLNPRDADILANLAGALIALGRTGEAAAACQRRVHLEPNSAEAHDALAAALLALGRPTEAVAASHRALALRPDHAEARIRLGDGLRELGRVAEAAAVLERAAAQSPGNARAWVSLGLALQEAGQGAEAARAIDRALLADPRSAAAWSVRGGLKTFTPGDPDLDTLAALLAATAPGAIEDRVDLEFTLGKGFMDIGDADRAFAHLDAGNRIKRATLRHDAADDAAELRAIATSLDAGRLEALAGGGDPSERPVFIVGMPRSGTTLAEQILASHPEVHGAGELTALETILIDHLGGALSPIDRARRLAALDARDLAALGGAYVARIAELAPGARRVIDKMPANFRFAGLIRLILPNARIIHCRRDPVDTCLSCYERRFSRGQAFTYDLRELGLHYRAYAGLMAHWRRLLPGDRFMEVRYEDVVDDLEGQARRLVGFCGLEWDNACLAFHRNRRPVRTASVNQVRQPIYRTSVARWKAHEAHLQPLLAALGPRLASPS